MAEKSRVRVAVRVRPQLEDGSLWVQVVDKSVLQTINHRNTSEALQYEFSSVYGPNASQKQVYDECVKPLLTHTMRGRNASVFAYGPTGAGKTHTILGTVEKPGVIPRCIKDVFTQVENFHNVPEGAKSPEWKCKVSFSYMEIYNEKVLDLLELKPNDLPIREDGHRNIFVAGLSEKVINNVGEFNDLFGPASKNRTTASTKLNERSSRSHSILMVKVHRHQKVAPYKILLGKLFVIDLAGSEDNRRTGNQGVRLKESGAINSSLLALGQVVEALNRGQPCVPYRGSKLTRLLQDSLGGNAVTCMIVNLSPEERHYFDTYTTLHFARKTKKIVNVVKVNETFEKLDSSTGFKRPAVDSTSEPPAKKAKTPEKNPAQADPTPFLSPLLRNQEKFKSQLRDEMTERLGKLEERLLNQMRDSMLNLTSSSHNHSDTEHMDPDSTTEDLDLTTPKSSQNVIENPSREALEELKKCREMLQIIRQEREQVSKEIVKSEGLKPKPPLTKTVVSSNPQEFTVPKLIQPKKKAKAVVYSDGSSKENLPKPPVPVSASPLFLNPGVIRRRRGIKTTAAKMETSEENLPSEVPENLPSEVSADSTGFDAEVRERHNVQILSVLNTGSVKDLQNLQTVGAKRAQLIHNWREVNGPLLSMPPLDDIMEGSTSEEDSLESDGEEEETGTEREGEAGDGDDVIPLKQAEALPDLDSGTTTQTVKKHISGHKKSASKSASKSSRKKKPKTDPPPMSQQILQSLVKGMESIQERRGPPASAAKPQNPDEHQVQTFSNLVSGALWSLPRYYWNPVISECMMVLNKYKQMAGVPPSPSTQTSTPGSSQQPFQTPQQQPSFQTLQQQPTLQQQQQMFTAPSPFSFPMPAFPFPAMQYPQPLGYAGVYSIAGAPPSPRTSPRTPQRSAASTATSSSTYATLQTPPQPDLNTPPPPPTATTGASPSRSTSTSDVMSLLVDSLL